MTVEALTQYPEDPSIRGVRNAIPDLERKYGLLYLVDFLRQLRRGQVEDLAAVLDTDSEQNKPRSLAEVARAASLLVDSVNRRRSVHDAFLSHVALSYTPEELHKQRRIGPIGPDDQPGSLVDSLAGSGPARPLVKEFYSLEGLGLVTVRTAEGRRELFVPTTRGRAYAETLGDIFDHVVNFKGKRRFLAVVTRYQTSIQPLPRT